MDRWILGRAQAGNDLDRWWMASPAWWLGVGTGSLETQILKSWIDKNIHGSRLLAGTFVLNVLHSAGKEEVSDTTMLKADPRPVTSAVPFVQ